MTELAGLLVAAALLVTLVTLEVRHVGPDPRHTASPRLLSRSVSRGVLAAMWIACLLLLLPRLLELLT
jgi:hypothetical protein